MTHELRLAWTADLHWGIRPAGDAATELLLEHLRAEPPDVLVLAGDIGAGGAFATCLERFAPLPCRKALIPGNHDLWVESDDPRGDSLQVYREWLPRLCAEYGFHYLDAGPLYLEEAGLALCGSVNWYDYSWSLETLKRRVPDWEERLRSKRFSRGRHNDARFIRWPLDDERFTALVVAALEQRIEEALTRLERVIVTTHHPPFYALSFPRLLPPVTADGLLWDAFTGNRRLESYLESRAERIPFAFCGHTHRAREGRLSATHGYNIGGDYHFKRLLRLTWPVGRVEEHVFGDPRG
jgi:predicted phosphohydrolase